MFYTKLLLTFMFLITIVNSNNNIEFCEYSKDTEISERSCGKNKYLDNKRYILFDVNPPEGFNLRRDVYIRVAVFMKYLIESDDQYHWKLVLPPWNKLYHWQSQDAGDQNRIPWRLFFDIDSLKKFIPVMEMDEFIKEYKSNDNLTIIDKVFILHNDVKMFETGQFDEINEIIDCNYHKINYKKIGNYYNGQFWGYNNITAKYVHCVTFHGSTSHLIRNLDPALYSSYKFDHMEIPLHDYYGSVDFWRARRSMRYNQELYDIANEFRRKYLDSNDEKDKTLQPDDWRNEKKKRSAIGGPYLAVHLRRRDFLTGRADLVPTIKSAAAQLSNQMKELELIILFVSTDAPSNEFKELKRELSRFKVYKYNPSDSIKRKFKDGGIAIVDQIICSHARHFIGTHESTFTFRIQEDREILGFPTSTTFNRLCGKSSCDRGSQWEIVW